MPVSATAVGSVSAFLSHFLSTESAAVANSQPSLSFSRSSSTRRPPVLGAPKVSVSGGSNTKTDGVVDQSSLLPDEIKQARMSADWKAARAYNEKGLIYEGRIESFNGGGLLIRFYSLLGFLPFPQLSPSHSCKEPHKTVQEIARDLTGSIMSVKVIQADEGNRKLIFSEKEAVWSKFSDQLSVGDIFEARVGSVEDYGAFVHLRFPDGNCHLTGLVHVSEVSWDLVHDVRDILTEGDEVRVKIINIDREKSRITLSIKQLEEDPLLETLDKVIPQDASIDPDTLNASDHFTIEPLPGLDTIMEELLQEDGIRDVKITRQGFEKRVVSQDLQLWLSNAPPTGDQYTLLARAGRQVQEIQLTTSLDQEGIKKAIQRVLERVP
ncbi:Nucleic acid-binding proteins superfamily [Forsythia ovata]|uniref:Nucleic acid-binding proteins superfamily n=1 Tax=Forsythia ovata TaxID=205694 RepID=A0ABD1PHP7_9LAMI